MVEGCGFTGALCVCTCAQARIGELQLKSEPHLLHPPPIMVPEETRVTPGFLTIDRDVQTGHVQDNSCFTLKQRKVACSNLCLWS